MAAAKASLISQPKCGRRTLLTADLQKRICAFIRQGSYDYSAAEACGISRHTFFEWLAHGEGRDAQRRDDRRYVEFACAVRRAQAEARVLAEIQIKKMDPSGGWVGCTAPARRTRLVESATDRPLWRTTAERHGCQAISPSR